ncbi:MAG TPA: hypothetical protein VF203_15125 [Burkholderiales bacterium]
MTVVTDQPYFLRKLGHDPKALAGALADVLYARLGGERDIHPLAQALLEDGIKTRDLVANIDLATRLLLESPQLEREAIARSASFYTTSDFSTALLNAMQRLIVETVEASSAYLQVARIIEAPNFREVDVPALALRLDGEDLDTPTSDAAEARYDLDLVLRPGLKAQVSSWSRYFGVTRRLLISDALNVVGAVVVQFGTVVARREARSVFGTLTANPKLSDGVELFHSDRGNIVAGALDLASLAEACGKLARLKNAAGTECGLTPRFLIVPPERYIDALKLVAELTAGNSSPPIQVFADPAITQNTWFVLPSPSVMPVVGFVRLAGARSTVGIDRRSSGTFDGQTFLVRHDHGAVALSHFAVRGQEGS